jgi:uncharacterized protein YaeQ
MNLQCTISGGELWVTDETQTVEVRPVVLRKKEI